MLGGKLLRTLIVLLTAWLLCPPSGQAAPPTVSVSKAKAQFKAAGKRAAALRAGFGKVQGQLLPPVLRWWKRAEKVTRTIVRTYDRIARSGVQPLGSYAVCEAGLLQSQFAEALHVALTQVATPKSVLGLGPSAGALYREKLQQAAQSKTEPLDVSAWQYHRRCLACGSCGKYFRAVLQYRRRALQRRAGYVTLAPGTSLPVPATSQPHPASPRARTQSWWYTRCRALEIVTKAQAPSPAECISLVVAELKRLVRRGDQLRRQQGWRAAIRAYTRALLLDPDWAPARRGRALAHASLGSRKGAVLDLVWWRNHKAGTPAAAQLDAEVARRLKKRRK